MKKIIVVAMTTVAMFGMVACSSNSSAPSPTVTVTQQAPSIDDPPTANPKQSNEQLYLRALKSMDNRIINNASDSDLIEVGYSVCDPLNAGLTVQDIIAYMAKEMVADGTTSDVYVEAVGYIIGAADTILCVKTF